MGRYRELVRALIFYSNCSNRSFGVNLTSLKNGVTLNKHEYQTLEYLVEFEDENKISADIARGIGILPSSVTKATKRLLSLGLIERFHIKGNKKSIILRPTKEGISAYHEYVQRDIQDVFLSFFKELDHFSDEDLTHLENAVHILSRSWEHLESKVLEKLPE